MAETFMMAVLLAAVYFDWKEGRVPNGLILAALPAVFIIAGYQNGIQNILSGLGYMLITILIFWPLFLIRGIGAGDIKLFALIAGLFGLKVLFWIFVCMICPAGIWAVKKYFRGEKTVLLTPFIAIGYVAVMAGRWRGLC